MIKALAINITSETRILYLGFLVREEMIIQRTPLNVYIHLNIPSKTFATLRVCVV